MGRSLASPRNGSHDNARCPPRPAGRRRSGPVPRYRTCSRRRPARAGRARPPVAHAEVVETIRRLVFKSSYHRLSPTVGDDPHPIGLTSMRTAHGMRPHCRLRTRYLGRYCRPGTLRQFKIFWRREYVRPDEAASGAHVDVARAPVPRAEHAVEAPGRRCIDYRVDSTFNVNPRTASLIARGVRNPYKSASPVSPEARALLKLFDDSTNVHCGTAELAARRGHQNCTSRRKEAEEDTHSNPNNGGR